MVITEEKWDELKVVNILLSLPKKQTLTRGHLAPVANFPVVSV